MRILYLAFRVFAATSLSLLIILCITLCGRLVGRAFGLEENRNAGEVVFGFLAGAIVVMIYRDRLDDRPERRERGK